MSYATETSPAALKDVGTENDAPVAPKVATLVPVSAIVRFPEVSTLIDM